MSPQPNGAPAPARPAPGGEASIGELVKQASTDVSTIIRGEVALAKLELTSAVRSAGTGVAFFAAAVLVLAFSLTFGFIALAEGIVALGLWRWLAYLIVFGFLLLLVVSFVLLGVFKVKRVRAPRQTIETGKDTVAYLKANVTKASTAEASTAKASTAEASTAKADPSGS